MSGERRVWYRAAGHGELPEGRVRSAPCGCRTVCLVHHDGRYSALDNRCPHQGGPLGEGSIENGLLRCPWHGWDFDPTTGAPPGGYDDGVETFGGVFVDEDEIREWERCHPPPFQGSAYQGSDADPPSARARGHAARGRA